MNFDEFKKVIMGLRSIYTSQNFIPDKDAVNMWYAVLKDLSYEEFATASQKYIATNKFPPTPADIRSIVVEIRTPEAKADWGESWNKVMKAVSRYGQYDEAEALNSFDEVTRQCVKRMGWKNICRSEELMADRANFRMIYEQVLNNAKDKAQLSPELNARIEQIGTANTTPLLEKLGGMFNYE